jgi:uncharacterized protein (TIGR02266 family)
MVFGKLLGQSPKRGIIYKDIKDTKALMHIACLEDALFQISSAINAPKDLNTILGIIVRGSLNCLKAHRSTVFLLDETNKILKTQFTHVSDPIYEQVGVNEEKEVARRTLQQNKPVLLQGAEDFSGFFKSDGRDRKLTSLISIPISSQGKTMGILSAVLINEEYGFDERNLRFFSSFGNFASSALEMVRLREEFQKSKDFRVNYDRYLDNILTQLQGFSQRERARIDTHIVVLQAEQKIDEKAFFERQTQENPKWVNGTITLMEEMGIERRKDERAEIDVWVDFDEEFWGSTENMSMGGAFILTPTPLDLGDEFLLQLHMADGGVPIAVTCKVVWTNQYGAEKKGLRKGMGVKFLDLQPESQKRIEEYIRSCRGKNPELENKIPRGMSNSKRIEEGRSI